MEQKEWTASELLHQAADDWEAEVSAYKKMINDADVITAKYLRMMIKIKGTQITRARDLAGKNLYE
jgi:hypothetical protein